MAQTIPVVNTAADNFQVFIERLNTVITVLGTNIVTVNSTLGVVTGNGYVGGVFGAHTFFANNGIRGGNNSVSNTLIITSGANVAGNLVANNIASNILAVSSIVFPNTNLDSISIATAANTVHVIDSFLKASYRSADYLFSMKDNDANNYQTTRLMVIHDGTNALSTEYGTIFTNTSIGVFETTTNTTHVIVNFTPVSNVVVCKAIRQLIAV